MPPPPPLPFQPLTVSDGGVQWPGGHVVAPSHKGADSEFQLPITACSAGHGDADVCDSEGHGVPAQPNVQRRTGPSHGSVKRTSARGAGDLKRRRQEGDSHGHGGGDKRQALRL